MKVTRTEPRKLVPAERAKRKCTPEEEYYLQDKWGEVSIKSSSLNVRNYWVYEGGL